MINLRITGLEINQIGPFDQLKLKFPLKPASLTNKAEIHIFTGENGTGKTTLLEVIAFALGNGKGGAVLSKNRNLKDLKCQLEIEYTGHEFWDNPVIILPGQPSQTLDQIFWNKYHNFTHEKFSTAFFAYSGYRRVEQVGISSIQEIHQHPFENALSFASSINPHLILQWIMNTKAGEAIAALEGRVEEAREKRNSYQKLEKVIGQIIDKKVEFKIETQPYSVKIAVDDEIMDFNQLPDGLKSIISWISDLMMRMDRVKWTDDLPVFDRHFILLLDEIEVHLHPAWQRRILPAVQKLFPNAQIFISTHSPFVVGSIDGAWIYKFEKPDGGSFLSEGFPVLSQDEKSYDFWLEEVFGIYELFGQEAQEKFDRRRHLLRKSDLSPEEKSELSDLDSDFGVVPPSQSDLGLRITEHLKRLKKNG